MSVMAKCLRLALSASNKLVQSHSNLQLAQNSLLRLKKCQTALNRQLSAAVVSPFLRQTAPTLTAVKTCTCTPRRLLQTEVDKELSKFLDKEIDYEVTQAGKSSTKVKGVDGFEVATEDAEVTLTRKAGNETIVVKLNINATVDSEGPLQASEQDPEAEMVSRPPFTVEMCKGDGYTLSLQCMFTSPEEMEQQGGPQDADAIVDSFEIHEVALHKGEWKDTIYSVSADIMDGNLYDLLMDMLDERGINEEFANQLVEFSTSYEHTRYLAFLKHLKSFVEK
ncbi:complement component 1 Q subcomponent-binding protein, mitochondrial-like [Littorina saxatilis]|uniref:Complement component 1 Q subcomponent-binding protein, mitochondrial n=1 Tax=Littorina saxatilis TaxID=31220 RepID=A0AAN9FXR0_9CAEN